MKPVGKKGLHWLVVFTLKKEFKPLLSVFICKRKRKQFLVLLYAWMQKETSKTKRRLTSTSPNVVMQRSDLWLRM